MRNVHLTSNVVGAHAVDQTEHGQGDTCPNAQASHNCNSITRLFVLFYFIFFLFFFYTSCSPVKSYQPKTHNRTGRFLLLHHDFISFSYACHRSRCKQNAHSHKHTQTHRNRIRSFDRIKHSLTTHNFFFLLTISSSLSLSLFLEVFLEY